MSGPIRFSNLGRGLVKVIRPKAALVELEEHGNTWVPFSVMATPTAADCEQGSVIDAFRVESWFADKLE